MTQVVRGQYEPFEKLLARFKKAFMASGIGPDARRRAYAMSRGERRRAKRATTAKRLRKALLRNSTGAR